MFDDTICIVRLFLGEKVKLAIVTLFILNELNVHHINVPQIITSTVHVSPVRSNIHDKAHSFKHVFETLRQIEFLLTV